MSVEPKSELFHRLFLVEVHVLSPRVVCADGVLHERLSAGLLACLCFRFQVMQADRSGFFALSVRDLDVPWARRIDDFSEGLRQRYVRRHLIHGDVPIDIHHAATQAKARKEAPPGVPRRATPGMPRPPKKNQKRLRKMSFLSHAIKTHTDMRQMRPTQALQCAHYHNLQLRKSENKNETNCQNVNLSNKQAKDTEDS